MLVEQVQRPSDSTRVPLIEPGADPELVDGFVFTIAEFVEMQFEVISDPICCESLVCFLGVEIARYDLFAHVGFERVFLVIAEILAFPFVVDRLIPQIRDVV